MILFWAGNKSKVADLNELITITSLGNIGESPIACGEGKFSAKTEINESVQTTIEMQCRYGKIGDIIEFGQISQSSYSTCQSFYNHNSDSNTKSTPYEWYFFPEGCEHNNFEESVREKIYTEFDEQCNGKRKCKFRFNFGMLPANQCTFAQSVASAYRYVLTASCVSDVITIGSADSGFKVEKGRAAMIVVLFDLIGTFILYLGLLAVNPCQRAVENDINGGTLGASDFTVMIPMVPHKDSADDMLPILWAWAENILEKERKQNYTNHETNMKDRD